MKIFAIILLIFNIFAFIYNCWIKHTLMILEYKRIEEFQQEIKHLKGQITQDKIFYYSEKEYIRKDKIKGKIKGLEKQQEENRKELYNVINSLNFRKIDEISNRISKNIIERDILKELLEEK